MAAASLTRGYNRSVALSSIISAVELDRPRLVAETGLSQATVFRVVDDLMQDGLVVETDASPRVGPGRNATRIRFNESHAMVVGVDLGGTNCRLVLSDALGNTLGRLVDTTPVALSGSELADWLAGHVFELTARYGQGAELGAVGIGLPGAVAGDKEHVIASVNLPQIAGTEFIDCLSEATGVPTAVDNDSNLALVGELQYGAVPRGGTVALLVIGTGLSAAVAVDGRVLSGREGVLGEFGRLPLYGSGYRVRDLVSGAGLVAYAADQGYDVSSTRELFAKPHKYRRVLDEVYRALTHLASIMSIAYEPQSIVVTGGFSESLDEASLARIAAQVETSVSVRTSIHHSSLGEAAGLLGAMSLGLSNLYHGIGVYRDDLAAIRSDSAAVIRSFEASAPEREPIRLPLRSVV
ncbi:ROK family protein [Gryllotalpicola reticulitermitis]|uniref:ROK family protein n=1 Tax=Gryllotalpicola reticulitermitis TaxID=1184153 RepID=A0ABV8QCW8_9MICO